MKKHYSLILIGMLMAAPVIRAQDARYAVYFTDKDTAASPYSLEDPGAFLSDRSLERRDMQDIKVHLTDLPLSPRYIDSVKPLVHHIQNRSRWLNLLVVEAPDSVVPQLTSKTFVRSVRHLAPAPGKNSSTALRSTQQADSSGKKNTSTRIDSSLYGHTWGQIEMLKGHRLHQGGYQGRGMTIAVLDAGFKNVDKLPAFDSLWVNDQILEVKDFEDHDGQVFDSHQHGTMVLSVIAANLPGTYLGTAPKAKFMLFRTEVTRSEFIAEEYNWVAAAEFADSAGAHIINSSLGYTTFDSAAQNHTYQDMDGNSTPITRAADLAASKGMLVVSSAGNLGSDPWHYISAPADADSIITVGAVDENHNHASFSSVGPTYDGRIKPEVAAQGVATVVQGADSSLALGNGTSFSAPIISGLMACLWEKNPSYSNMQLRDLLLNNASQPDNPDSLIGYGIPNFSMAGGLGLETIAPAAIRVYPNPFKTHFYIRLPEVSLSDQTISVNIFDILGRKRYSRQTTGTVPRTIQIDALNGAPSGIYLIRLSLDQKTILKEKIIKQ